MGTGWELHNTTTKHYTMNEDDSSSNESYCDTRAKVSSHRLPEDVLAVFDGLEIWLNYEYQNELSQMADACYNRAEELLRNGTGSDNQDNIPLSVQFVSAVKVEAAGKVWRPTYDEGLGELLYRGYYEDHAYAFAKLYEGVNDFVEAQPFERWVHCEFEFRAVREGFGMPRIGQNVKAKIDALCSPRGLSWIYNTCDPRYREPSERPICRVM